MNASRILEAERAVKELRQHLHFPECSKNADACAKIKAVDDRCADIIDGLLTIIKEGFRWIPIGERLPTEWKPGKTISNTLVMLTAQDEEVIGTYSISSGWWDSHGEPVEDVTHWLELPLSEREKGWRG